MGVQLAKHLTVCPLETVMCKWRCGVVGLLREDQSNHEEELCPLRLIECPRGAVAGLRQSVTVNCVQGAE